MYHTEKLFQDMLNILKIIAERLTFIADPPPTSPKTCF